MKRILLAIFCITLLVGCGKDETTEAVGNADIGGVADYFPIEPDIYYVYDVTGLQSGDTTRTIYNHYISDNRVQRYINSPAVAGSSVEIIETTNDEVKLIYGDGVYYFYEDITNSSSNIDATILKGPIEVGTSWSDNEIKSSITSISVPIETPSGTYDCIEVTSILPDGAGEEKYYYAKDVGLVQSIHPSPTGDAKVTLSSVQRDQAILVPAYFYFLNTTTGNIEQITRDLGMKTNDDFIAQLESQMKLPPTEEYAATLPPDVTINSVVIDRATASAVVDFSDTFPKDSPVGEGVQVAMIQCIVDTIGNFYDLKEVSLTIDGGPFKVGEIVLPMDEYVQVKEPSEYVDQNLAQ